MSVVIVGGGIAGAATACRLARAGARPLLIEREAAPHDKVCGEFLSVETIRHLTALGLDPIALGAEPIGEVRLVHRGAVARAALPFPALSLSRRRLDEALLEHAARLGAKVERGVAVKRLGDVAARSLFVATGKHALRGVERPRGGELAGLKMYFRLEPRQARELAGAVELILVDGGYAGLQLVEGDRANLCLLTRRGGDGWAAAIASCAHLARRLDGAEPLLARPLAIANLPYGMVHRPSAADPAGLFRIGDQWGMIPSFTGDGMALALTTATLAAQAWHDGAPAAAYHARAGALLGPRLRLAARLAEAGLMPGVGAAIAWACRATPRFMALVARMTRVPEAAMVGC